MIKSWVSTIGGLSGRGNRLRHPTSAVPRTSGLADVFAEFGALAYEGPFSPLEAFWLLFFSMWGHFCYVFLLMGGLFSPCGQGGGAFKFAASFTYGELSWGLCPYENFCGRPWVNVYCIETMCNIIIVMINFIVILLLICYCHCYCQFYFHRT